MKYIIILALLLLLGACDAPSDHYGDRIVNAISHSNYPGKCWFGFGDRNVQERFLDSCNKWAVGDSVILKPYRHE